MGPVGQDLKILPMRFTVFDDHEAMSLGAAEIMATAVADKPDLLFCAASGDSPTRAYELFAAKKGVGKALRVMKLDEWAGLAADDDASCEAYLRRHLVEPLAIPPERYWSLDGGAAVPVSQEFYSSQYSIVESRLQRSPAQRRHDQCASMCNDLAASEERMKPGE